MNIVQMIRSTWTFQHSLTEADVPKVAFACQMLMEDSGEVDEDGALSAYQMQRIEEKFPGCNYVAILTTAQSVLELVEEAFGQIATGSVYE